MRRLSFFPVLGVVFFSTPCGAMPAPDSTVSVQQAPGPEQFTLYLERDGTRNAVYVEPRADGMVALTASDGTVDHVPMYRVSRVTNQDGVDLTSRLRRREWLGTPPPRPEKPPKNEPWRPYRFRSGPGTVCGSTS